MLKEEPKELSLTLIEENNVDEEMQQLNSGNNNNSINNNDDENNNEEENESIPIKVEMPINTTDVKSWREDPRVWIYFSHALSSWGDRLFGFAVPVLFIGLFPKTLLLPSLFAFSSNLGCVIFGSYMGSIIDKSQRLPLIRWSLILQNVCVLLSTIMLLLIYPFKGDKVPYDNLKFFILLLILNFSGFVGSLASLVESIAVSKDWVIVLCEKNPELMAKTNATMRRINLICEIGAPFIFGLMLTFMSEKAALIFILVWNIVSFFPEYFVLHSIYYKKTALIKNEEELRQQKLAKPNPFVTAVKSWKDYYKHIVLLASLSYVMLYITVLSPGALMTAYLSTQGIENWMLGIFRGLGAVAGISSTFLAPLLIDKLGIRKSGILFLLFQNSFLIVGLISFLFPKVVHAYIFLFAVVFSRMGLWGFDLVEVQIMQISISDSERGSINSVESSMSSLATLISFALGIIVNRPSDFFWLVLVSYICVTSAGVLFSLWSFFQRNNIMFNPKPKLNLVDDKDKTDQHLLSDTETTDNEILDDSQKDNEEKN